MLKKIISLIICAASAFCITACSNTENQSTSTSSTTKPILKPPSFTDSNSGNTSTDGNKYAYSYSYKSFEENLEEVNTVVKAGLVSIADYGDERVKFTFTVNEVLLGKAEETIDVIVTNWLGFLAGPDGSQIYFSNDGVFSDIHYDNEDFGEFLLMLVRSEDVYNKVNPRYQWQRGMIINLDYIPKSEMYNEPLAKHATGIDVNTCTKEELIDYVCKLSKGNVQDKVISKAETLEDIVSDSENVFHISVKEMQSKGDNAIKSTEIWTCEIKETMKGILPEGRTQISVVFFGDTVKAGEEYIVAVEEIDGSALYRFITTNSLRPVSEKAEIKGYIN